MSLAWVSSTRSVLDAWPPKLSVDQSWIARRTPGRSAISRRINLCIGSIKADNLEVRVYRNATISARTKQASCQLSFRRGPPRYASQIFRTP